MRGRVYTLASMAKVLPWIFFIIEVSIAGQCENGEKVSVDLERKTIVMFFRYESLWGRISRSF